MTHNTTSYRTLDEIKNLVRSFEKCTLPRNEWTHQAHLIVALWYLTRYPEAEVVELVRDTPEGTLRDRIQKYNATQGIHTTQYSGYNETITLFWIQIVRNFLAAEGVNFPLVHLANYLLLSYGDKNLPFEYYSRQLLMSWEARKHWVEPDLKPLPN
jgi:hypothetical protein